MSQSYIVFFDSGIGGLTLLEECCRKLEGERLLYYGDNENAPYGNKSSRAIEALALNAFNYLSGFPVKAAVLACNTVTAECAEALRRRFSFPIVGVEPALKPAAKRCKNVLVIATKATLSSRKFSGLCESVSADCRFTFHCPKDLAGEIESKIADLSQIDLARHLPRGDYDGAVLGCTHYIYLRREISAYLKCPVFDGNAGTADHLIDLLARSETLCTDFSNSGEFESKGETVCLYSKDDKKYRRNEIYFAGNSALKNKKVFHTLLNINICL